MTNTLIITRGLPACGKSTKAMRWVAEDPAGRARVGTDQIADMLHDETRPDEDDVNTTYAELQTTVALQGAIGALLHAGFDVVCDDTNLLPSHIEALRLVAARHHAAAEVWDMTDVDVETCIQRDEERGLEGGRWVGEKRIRYMFDLYHRHQPRVVNGSYASEVRDA